MTYYTGADLHAFVNNNIYIHLLTITHWHNKTSIIIVTKTLVKSICLGVQHRQLNY